MYHAQIESPNAQNAPDSLNIRVKVAQKEHTVTVVIENVDQTSNAESFLSDAEKFGETNGTQSKDVQTGFVALKIEKEG